RRLGEEVVAGAVSGGVVGDRLTQAIGARQGQRDARNPQLARVLATVAVAVVPDEVADLHRLVVAEVDRRVAAAPGQRAGCGAAGIGLAVLWGGAARVQGRRCREARQAAARCEVVSLHDALPIARRLGEEIVAGAVGGGVVGDRLTQAIGAGQGKREAGYAQGQCVQSGRAVAVVPDEVADLHRLVVAEVDRRVAAAAGQRAGGGAAGI